MAPLAPPWNPLLMFLAILFPWREHHSTKLSHLFALKSPQSCTCRNIQTYERIGLFARCVCRNATKRIHFNDLRRSSNCIVAFLLSHFLLRLNPRKRSKEKKIKVKRKVNKHTSYLSYLVLLLEESRTQLSWKNFFQLRIQGLDFGFLLSTQCRVFGSQSISEKIGKL